MGKGKWKILDVFFDGGGRKYAILQCGTERFLAWRSLSKKKWLVAPFVVDRYATYWVAKGSSKETPQLPAGIALRLDRLKAATHDLGRIKKEFSSHGLLWKCRPGIEHSASAWIA